MSEREMHCSEEDFSGYFMGTLPDDEASLVEQHLGRCGDCRDAAREPGRSALALHEWTTRGHIEAREASVAASATAPPVVAIDPRRWLRSYLLPGSAAAAGIAATVLLAANLRDHRELERQSRRIAQLTRASSEAATRVAQLQARLDEMQSRPQPVLGRPAPPISPPGPPELAVVALEPIELRAASMGQSGGNEANRDVQVRAPAFRLPLFLPSRRVGDRVTVELKAPDGTGLQRELTVTAIGGRVGVVLEVNAAAAKPLLNRPVRLSAEVPNDVTIGATTLTLTAR